MSPTKPDKAADRRGAEETRVDLQGNRLTVTVPKPRFSTIGSSDESVDLLVELPAGSRLTAEVAVGDVRTAGRLGATRVRASMGLVDIDTTGDLRLRAGHGSATVGTADGGVEITADHGQIRVGTITGDAILKASHGSLVVGEGGGDLEARLSYGDLETTRALGSVAATTAYGSIRLDQVSRGSVQVESGFGQTTVLARLRSAAADTAADGTTDPSTLELQAELVTTIGAALMQAVGVRAVQAGVQPSPQAPEQLVELLRPIWARLL